MYSRVVRFVSMVSLMNIHGRRIVRLVRIDAPPSGLSGVRWKTISLLSKEYRSNDSWIHYTTREYFRRLVNTLDDLYQAAVLDILVQSTFKLKNIRPLRFFLEVNICTHMRERSDLIPPRRFEPQMFGFNNVMLKRWATVDCTTKSLGSLFQILTGSTHVFFVMWIWPTGLKFAVYWICHSYT